MTWDDRHEGSAKCFERQGQRASTELHAEIMQRSGSWKIVAFTVAWHSRSHKIRRRLLLTGPFDNFFPA